MCQLNNVYGLKLDVEVKDNLIRDVLEDSLTAFIMKPREKLIINFITLYISLPYCLEDMHQHFWENICTILRCNSLSVEKCRYAHWNKAQAVGSVCVTVTLLTGWACDPYFAGH
jgi:hypothetical protein